MDFKKRKKILIVDDHEEIRETYVNVFSKSGFDVIEAKDGVEGLDKATSEEGIDIIFTGIIMPRMDGFQMIEALKKNTSTSNIPVFVSSHLGREDDREKAFELGVKDFIIRSMIPPSDVVKIILHEIDGDKSYELKVDPFEMDGQEFIQDLSLPEELLCDNCGSNLVLKIKPKGKSAFETEVVCSGCHKRF